MEEDSNSPVFAGRYRFQPVGNDWDRGRSGLTHLVLDEKKGRLGVMKRAELTSHQAVERLQSELKALVDLKGTGVPKVFNTGEAEYGSKKYFYIVIEYIEGMRVEQNLATLTAFERAEILTQLFGILAKAHKLGIVNGDVDEKHLFWQRGKRELIVIDWGNAYSNTSPKNRTEYAYDLARAAEIIYSLVTLAGHPQATGSITLPDESGLVSELKSLPEEFRDLCQWAPRTPIPGMVAPYTGEELFEVSTRWRDAVQKNKPYKPTRPGRRLPWIAWGVFILIVAFLLAYRFIPNLPISLSTPTNTASPTFGHVRPSETSIPATITDAPTPATTFTETIVPSSPTTTFTLVPAITPSPRSYKDTQPIRVFEQSTAQTDQECWTDESASSDFEKSEGFARRLSDQRWSFKTLKRTPEEAIQTDFSGCLDAQQVGAIALNIWMEQLEPKREFGFFIEDADGVRHEFTIWVDNVENVDRLYVRVRANDTTNDYEQLIINDLKPYTKLPRPYYRIPIQMFLEIDNQGLDILYLKQGRPQEDAEVDKLDPANMKRIDSAVLPALNNIQKVGLIGYGGATQTVIFPLAFFGK